MVVRWDTVDPDEIIAPFHESGPHVLWRLSHIHRVVEPPVASYVPIHPWKTYLCVARNVVGSPCLFLPRSRRALQIDRGPDLYKPVVDSATTTLVDVAKSCATQAFCRPVLQVASISKSPHQASTTQ